MRLEVRGLLPSGTCSMARRLAGKKARGQGAAAFPRKLDNRRGARKAWRMFPRILLATFLLVFTARAAEPKPNILWLIAEDMGPTALGCYGQKEVATPNLDRLAADGVRFTRAYTTAPV